MLQQRPASAHLLLRHLPTHTPWQYLYGLRCTFTYLLPRHTVPCHAMPCHAMPCHTIPYHTIPHHTIPYHTIPYHTIPYHTMPCHAMYKQLYGEVPSPPPSLMRAACVIWLHRNRDRPCRNILQVQTVSCSNLLVPLSQGQTVSCSSLLVPLSQGAQTPPVPSQVLQTQQTNATASYCCAYNHAHHRAFCFGRQVPAKALPCIDHCSTTNTTTNLLSPTLLLHLLSPTWHDMAWKGNAESLAVCLLLYNSQKPFTKTNCAVEPAQLILAGSNKARAKRTPQAVALMAAHAMVVWYGMVW